MHVAATMTFDPSTVEGGYSFDKVRDVLQGRLHLIPQFRQRLAAVPFNLHHPVWVEDPDFDLDYHLRRIAAPAPGSYHELADIAGDIAGRQLDRSRPLWEIWVVEGLEHGHIGVIAKMHHSTIDGVSGANLMVHLFDMEATPTEDKSQPEDWEPDHIPSDAELLAYAVRSRLRRPLQIASVIPKVAQAVVNVVRNRRSTDTINAPAPLTAPRTSFNGAITPHRKVAYSIASLEDIKAIKNAFGTTVNDVVLSVMGGGLRRYLQRTGQLPDKSLIATVPISVRPPEGEDAGVGANKVSAMFTSLATDIDDPVERLYKIHEVTKGAKEEHKAIGADMLQSLAEFAAPAGCSAWPCASTRAQSWPTAGP